MAIAGKAKTKLVDGERVSISTGLPMTSSAITSATLSPQTSFNLTPPKPSTKAEGMTAGFEVGADQFTKNLERERSEAAALRESSLGGYTDALASQLTESGATAKAYGQEGGVDDIQSELDTINSQLIQEQHSNRRRIEALDKNPEGMLRSQVEAEKQRINTESLRRQADLSIIQMGIQGRYDSAKTIADRAVDAILEGEKNRLEALRVNYEENKDLFDKADQRAFETAQGDRERKLQNEEYRLRAEFDQKIKQSDPAYRAQLQQTNLQIKKLQQELTGTNYDISNLTPEQFSVLPSIDKNNTTLLNIFSSGKVSAANKTLIGNAMALAKSAQDFAGANPDADFGGLYPFRGLVDFISPKAFKREETVQNESFINSLNLQTQYWASGAALTDAQTELVMTMVPTTSDTDAQVKTKVNQLVNYMMGQTASRLQTDGINFQPEPVNLFETYDMMQQLSDEQKLELESLGLIQK